MVTYTIIKVRLKWHDKLKSTNCIHEMAILFGHLTRFLAHFPSHHLATIYSNDDHLRPPRIWTINNPKRRPKRTMGATRSALCRFIFTDLLRGAARELCASYASSFKGCWRRTRFSGGWTLNTKTRLDRNGFRTCAGFLSCVALMIWRNKPFLPTDSQTVANHMRLPLMVRFNGGATQRRRFHSSASPGYLSLSRRLLFSCRVAHQMYVASRWICNV